VSDPARTPSPRRAFRLRTLAAVALTIAAIHVTSLWIYLGVGVGRRARAVGIEITAILDLFAELQQRTAIIRSAVAYTYIPLPEDATATAERAARLRALVSGVGVRVAATPFAGVPAGMRVPLARADDDLTRLQNSLLEFAALLELGRAGEARVLRVRVDSLMTRLQARLADAQQVGLTDLRRRELALHESARRTELALLVWMATGLLLLGALSWTGYRRVMRPLDELEEGLRRVATGELTTRVPVHRTDELGRLAALFNETARVLEERAEQQGRFAAAGELIAGVAHEVNNPLMAVAAIAEMQAGVEHLAPETRAEFAQVGAQARRAGKLLAGLLRFVRTQGPQPGPVELNVLLDRAVDLLAYRLPVEQVEVSRRFADDLPPAEGDPMRVEQVFVNLTSNALDALRDIPTPRRLELRTWHEGGRVYAAVRDNGPGVRPEVLPRLFAPFVTSKGHRGTGLGLYISRQIVRGGGGEIRYESPDDGGSAFVVDLPVAVARAAPEAAASPPDAAVTPETEPASAPTSATPAAPALAGLSALVVEDEEAIRRLLSRFMTGRGMHVTTAADGLEALDHLRQIRPDVILMDLKMPGMSGAAVYDRLLRDRPDLAERVLILSGDLSQLDELGEGHTLPADRIVAKPVSLADLESRMLAVTGRRA